MRAKKILVLAVSLCLTVFMSSIAQSVDIKKVETLYETNQFPKAITLLRAAIKADNNDVAAHKYLVKCYNKLKQLDNVLSEYNTLSVKEPENPIYKFMVGYVYDLKGNTASATRLYQEVLAIDPKLPFVHYNLGWIYDDEGDTAAAIEQYEAEIKVNPSNLDAYHNLANAYRKKKNYDMMISTAQKMLAADPGNIRAYDNLGWAYSDQGQLDKALKEWRKTIDLSPQDVEAGEENVEGRILDAKGMYNSAMRQFLKGIKKNPNNARLHNNLGMAYVHKVTSQTFGKKNTKWLREAIEEFKKAIAINSKYAEAYLSLGNAYFKLGMSNDGIKQYEQYVKLKPNDIAGLNILGNAYKEMGRYEDAKRVFNEAIDKAPKDAAAYANLGTVYYYQGLQDAAMAQWQKSLKLDPYQPLLKERLETAFKKLSQ